MGSETRRKRTLELILRHGEIEKKTALRDLGDARAEEARLSSTIARSQAIASDPAHRSESRRSDTLRAAMALSAAMTRLSEDAERMRDAVSQRTQSANDRLQQTDARLGKAKRQLRLIERCATQRTESAAASEAKPGLARSLRCSEAAVAGARSNPPQKNTKVGDSR